MTQRLLIKAAALLVLLSSLNAYSFCGFYVAKADATLFNNKSEIILVRDGTRTSITMSNDFKGILKLLTEEYSKHLTPTLLPAWWNITTLTRVIRL